MTKNTKTPQSLSKLSGQAFGKDGNSEVFTYPRFEDLQKILQLGVDQRTMTMVTAKAGMGKTTAIRCFTRRLPAHKYLVLYFGQDQDGGNLLRRFALSLGLTPKFRRTALTMQISQALSDNAHDGGKEVVAVIDEAHLLDDQTLEDIRLLTNNDFDTSSPVSIILLGQQALRMRLKASRFEALKQRLRYRYFLEGLSLAETEEYIKDRLTKAGGQPDIFSKEAIARIFEASEGVPREINNLCALSMVQAELSDLSSVDEKLVRQMILQRELS